LAVDAKAGVDEGDAALNGDKRTSHSTGSPFLGVEGRPRENSNGRELAKGKEQWTPPGVRDAGSCGPPAYCDLNR